MDVRNNSDITKTGDSIMPFAIPSCLLLLNPGKSQTVEVRSVNTSETSEIVQKWYVKPSYDLLKTKLR